MDTPHELYDETLKDFIKEIASIDLASEDATTAMRNLETFSKIRPHEPTPEPAPEPIPEPLTGWSKVRASVACALDNETTRTFIKAGGAFAGVALVAYTTIRRDHIVERQALSQANQSNS